MADLRDVDTSDAPELNEGFKAIPPGMYELYMESSERKTTSNGEGEYLACVFKVGRGDHENAKIFCNFNFWNKNPTAVEIAKSSWRAICEATLGQPNAINGESASLHNKLFVAEVENKPAYNKESKKNDHPTNRTNEIVFRKGTILNSKQYFTSQQQASKPATASGGSQEPQGQQTASAPAATTVKPGAGTAPWKKG